jgi:hypothetical protein
MNKVDTDLAQLMQDVLDGPPSMALPSNLSDHWLDISLRYFEEVVNATDETDSSSLRLPVILVSHLLKEKTVRGMFEISDEQLFRCLKQYRVELAMEKLRRWGVCLRLPATEETIFFT